MAFFYPFGDPHWLARPEKSTRPWMMDISGNGLHGEVYGDIVLSKNPTPHINTGTTHPKEYSSLRFGIRPNTYLDVTDPDYDLSNISVSTTSSYAYMLQWKSESTDNSYNSMGWTSYYTDFSVGVS